MLQLCFTDKSPWITSYTYIIWNLLNILLYRLIQSHQRQSRTQEPGNEIQGAVLPTIPKYSNLRISWVIFVILVPSKPSIVFSFQNPFYSQPLFLLVNVVVVVFYFKAILLINCVLRCKQRQGTGWDCPFNIYTKVKTITTDNNKQTNTCTDRETDIRNFHMFWFICFYSSHRLFSRLRNHSTASLTIPLGDWVFLSAYFEQFASSHGNRNEEVPETAPFNLYLARLILVRGLSGVRFGL